MKTLFYTLFLTFFSHSWCLAQDAPPPRLIVQTGVGLQWFGETFKNATLSIERPMGAFWHLGVQGSWLFKKSSNDFFYTYDFRNGYEIGAYTKHFLHGRFSGRKSGLYLGPEVRVGLRRFYYINFDVFPPSPQPALVTFHQRTTKFLLRWGMQWRFGQHTSLEICAPFGMEFTRATSSSDVSGEDSQFVMLPCVLLGMAF